ncbi:hypothetical protein BGX27_005366 [Mortierella sp. AM989]|nr:hypothetical protein BGX27_005366 [Mortierella sp. AM989]
MAPVNLTSEHLHMFLASCGIHLTYFYLIKTFVPFIGKDRRRLSWVLTLATALIVSVLGPYATFSNLRTVFSEPIPYEMYAVSNSHIIAEGPPLFQRYDISFQPSTERWSSNFLSDRDEQLGLLNGQDIANRIEFYKTYDATYASSPSVWYSLRHSRWFFDLRFTPSDSPITQAAVIFFACYLILDMVCGFLHYRERISILTGWFHHTMYTGICYYTVVTGESHSFTSFMVIEIPTFIMGLGFLHKPLRHDMIFGSSFFLFRILYDFSLTHEMIMNRPDLPVPAKIILLFKSAMNFKFFMDWINQQIRLRRKKACTAVIAACETSAHTTETRSELKIPMSVSPVAPNPSEKYVNGITTLVYQPQPKAQRQQSKHGKAQSSQKGRRRASNGMLTDSTPDSSSFLTPLPSKSRHVLRNRNTRARAGGMLDDQAFVDMITVH